MNILRNAVLAAALLGLSSTASATTGLCCLEPAANPVKGVADVRGVGATTVLSFEGLGDLETVLDFYDGGLGGAGSGPGPDFGITFGTAALSIISGGAGGSGNFALNPSGDTVLFFLSGTAIMNVPGGFDEGFSFFYSAANLPGFVRVYDGLDGTGNLLTELTLPVTPPTGTTPFTFDNWQPVGVNFTGVARSVDFGGTIDQIGFDDITLGSATPGGGVPIEALPVPGLGTSGMLLMGLLLSLLALVRLRRG
jgi:hypothetical protein